MYRRSTRKSSSRSGKGSRNPMKRKNTNEGQEPEEDAQHKREMARDEEAAKILVPGLKTART